MKNIIAILGFVSLCFFVSKETRADDKSYYLLIAGDSIVQTYLGNHAKRQQGWGQRIGDFLVEEVEIENFAASGKSTKTFKGNWKKLSAKIQNGTFVFIQFGHNDSHNSSRPEATDAKTDYIENLIRYINDVKKKGGVPVLVTPPYRRNFDKNGKLLPYMKSKTVGPSNLKPYAEAIRELAEKENVCLVDLFKRSGEVIQSLGNDGARPLFVTTDIAHSSPLGAKVHAKMILLELVKKKHKLAELIDKEKLNDFEIPIPKIKFVR